MEIRYRALLLVGAMSGLVTPALAQPANLLAPLKGQTSQVSYADKSSLLDAAHNDVEKSQWKSATDKLERSETLLLNSAVASSNGVLTSPSEALPYIIQARGDVQERDQTTALLAIDKAMALLGAPGVALPTAIGSQVASPPHLIASPTVNAPSAHSAPMVTKALLPGHWQLTGWKYTWVPPDTDYRSVQSKDFIPGHYQYRVGAWIWISGQYANPTG